MNNHPDDPASILTGVIPERLIVPAADLRLRYQEQIAASPDVHVDWDDLGNYVVESVSNPDLMQKALMSLDEVRDRNPDHEAWVDATASSNLIRGLYQRLHEIGHYQYALQHPYAFDRWLGDDLMLCRVDTDPMSNHPPRS